SLPAGRRRTSAVQCRCAVAVMARQRGYSTAVKQPGRPCFAGGLRQWQSLGNPGVGARRTAGDPAAPSLPGRWLVARGAAGGCLAVAAAGAVVVSARFAAGGIAQPV